MIEDKIVRADYFMLPPEAYGDQDTITEGPKRRKGSRWTSFLRRKTTTTATQDPSTSSSSSSSSSPSPNSAGDPASERAAGTPRSRKQAGAPPTRFRHTPYTTKNTLLRLWSVVLDFRFSLGKKGMTFCSALVQRMEFDMTFCLNEGTCDPRGPKPDYMELWIRYYQLLDQTLVWVLESIQRTAESLFEMTLHQRSFYAQVGSDSSSFLRPSLGSGVCVCFLSHARLTSLCVCVSILRSLRSVYSDYQPGDPC